MAVSDIRGNVDTIILKVLFEGDRYGYDMVKAINARGGGQWEIKQPTLYARLKSLEKQGFISSYRDSAETGGGTRKYYTLTDRGREVFITYRNEFERTRDLFTNLITGDASPVQFDDDFSDVEDESYDIPKKRRPRPTKKHEKKSEPADNAASDTLDLSDSDNNSASQEAQHSFTPVAEDEFTEKSDDKAQETVSNEYVVETEIPEPDYVQQSFFSFSDAVDEKDTEHQQTQNETAEKDEKASAPEKPVAKSAVITETVDPHELVSRIYESSAADKRGYFDSSDKSSYDEEYPEDVKPAVKQPAVVAPPTSPAPTVSAPPPVPVDSSASALAPLSQNEEESLARREYRDILGDLIERSETRQNRQNDVDDEEQIDDEVASSGDRIEIRRFSDVIESVEELGNHVEVRDHNDSARQYNRQFYYYSHKLMFTHYCVMCALMLILGMVLFFTFRSGLGLKQRYDYVLFIFMGLIPIAMLLAAIIIFAADPDKKKRINVNFRFSIIIRIVIMIQAAVVVYCLNLIWGMPVGFSASYVPSLVIPMAYALFIPLSEVIFMNLLKSERYAVSE